MINKFNDFCIALYVKIYNCLTGGKCIERDEHEDIGHM